MKKFLFFITLLIFLMTPARFVHAAGITPTQNILYRLGFLAIEVDPFFAEHRRLDRIDGIYVKSTGRGAGLSDQVYYTHRQRIKTLKSKYKTLDRLLPGDVIVKVSGKRAVTIAEFIDLLNGEEGSETLRLTVRRKGKDRQLQVPFFKNPYTHYPVTGHRQSKLYHLPDVGHTPAEGQPFANRAAAEDAAYHPCGICFPVVEAPSRITELEQAIGGGLVREVQSKFRILNDRQKQITAESILERIRTVARRKDIEYKIIILNTPQINAHTSPSGEIFIHRGLFDISESADELAFVIAHEMSHIIEEHHIKQYNSIKTQKRLFGVLGAVAQATIGDPIIGAGIDSGAVLFRYLSKHGYSRKQEKDADLSALAYLMKAGFEIDNSMQIVRKLQDEAQRTDDDRNTFSSNHPSPGDRVKYLTEAYGRWSEGRIRLPPRQERPGSSPHKRG